MSNSFEILKKSEIIDNNKFPLISIIIPTFNRELLVEKALKSAICQTYPNFEIVIIDNASEDKTIERTLNLVKEDSRVSVIRNKENIGPVANWFRGVYLSKGIYSKILFSDDFLFPDCLSNFYENFDSDIGLVCSSCLIGENTRDASIMCKFSEGRKKIKSRTLIYRYLITRSFLMSPCAAMFRKEDLKESLKNSLDNPICRESVETGAGPDVKIYLDILQKYPYFGYLRTPQVFFKVHKGSFTIGKYKKNVLIGYKMTFDKFIDESSYLIKFISIFHNLYKVSSNVYRFFTLKFKGIKFLNF